MSVSTDANCVQTIQTTEEKLAEKKKELENFQVFFTWLTEQKEDKIILLIVVMYIILCLFVTDSKNRNKCIIMTFYHNPLLIN